MKIKIINILIVLIILWGAFLRFYALEKSPPSLGFDEAALGYNAYSILKTGKDEYGNFLPLSLRSFNDYKPALYAYLTVPFIKFFGLNDASVRMTSALAGTVSLIFLYLLLKEFIKNKFWLTGLFFILSFEPWRLHFSRNAFETHLSTTLFCIGAWFLLKSKKKIKYLVGAVIFLSLSLYSYHSARVAAPMLVCLWIIDPINLLFKYDVGKAIRTQWNKNWKKILVLVGVIGLSIPIFMANSGSLLLTRFHQENVFNRFYPYAPREFVNPISSLYYFLGIISGHIFSNISPINLNFRIFKWVKMSPQFIPGMGMLGWIEGIVFIFGLLTVIKNIFKLEKYRFLVYWIIAGIAPAAATWTWFHPLRSLNIYPAMEVIVALGFINLFKYKNKIIKNEILKIISNFVIVGILFTTIIFTINNELLYSAYENNGEYQPGGFKEGMPYLKSIQDNYEQVIIDSPHAQNFIFLFFYQAMDPNLVQKYADIRPKPGTEGNLDFNFDKFVFRKIDWPKDNSLKKTVFWTSPEITDSEVDSIDGAKIQLKVFNSLYHTADIITTE